MNPVINYSEFAALAACETKWGYGYLLGDQETGPRRGLHLGTLIHLWGDRWLRGLGATLPASWTDDINTGGKPGEVRTLTIDSFEPELVERALWLAERYMQHYGDTPPKGWEVVSSEEWLTATVVVGGKEFTLVGRTDGLVRINGLLWLRELKSYGSKNRLDTIHVEPQPSVYYKLVEANYGEPPFGILYDGVYTYQWALKKPTQGVLIAERAMRDTEFALLAKKAQTEWARGAVEQHPGVQEHPPEDSFRREWPDRSPEQIEIAMRHLQVAIGRREQITSLDDTMPNVGSACNSCGFKPKCWARLTLDDELDVEEVDLTETEPV